VGLRTAQEKTDNAASVPIFKCLIIGTLKAGPKFMPMTVVSKDHVR
jgi:hypothetical protein